MNSTISIVKHKQVVGIQGWHAIFSSTNQLGLPYCFAFKLARRCRYVYISFGFGHTPLPFALCPLPGMSHGHFSFSFSEVPWPFVYCYILDTSDYLPYARTSNELVRKFNMISSTANFECKYATVEMARVGWNS